MLLSRFAAFLPAVLHCASQDLSKKLPQTFGRLSSCPRPIVVDGQTVNLDNPAVVIDGKTYLPLRAVGEVLNVNVGWNDEKRQAEIKTKGVEIVENQNDTLPRWEHFDTYYDENGEIYKIYNSFYSGKILKHTSIEAGKTIDEEGNVAYDVILTTQPTEESARTQIIKENIPYILATPPGHTESEILISEKYFYDEILPLDKEY